MKATKILFLCVFAALILPCTAQNSIFQATDTPINHVKIKNNSHKTYINISSSRVTDTVSVLFATGSENATKIAGLFSVRGDTLTVEDKQISADADITIELRLKNCPKTLAAYGNSDVAMLNNETVRMFSLFTENNSRFCMVCPQTFVADTLIIKADGTSQCIVSDSIAVKKHLDIEADGSAQIRCHKYSFPSQYCRLNQNGGKIFLDNKPFDIHSDLERQQNNLPSGVNSLQFYWKISADAGFVVPKSDFWGRAYAYNDNFDFLWQINFHHKNSLIAGWGFGFKYLHFSADGYSDGLNVENKNNQILYRTCQTVRFPVMYRRYLDNTANAPSVDIGLTPYIILRPSWHMKYSDATDTKPLSKSAVTFEDVNRKFQLDAYLGLNLGRKFSIYTQASLLPVLDKAKTDKMRSITVGISYKLDFTTWNW